MPYQNDEYYLRAAIEAGYLARQAGNHPFGAVLVNPEGEILLEGQNTVITQGDCTGHAEINLIREASTQYSSDYLWKCTLYASTEPCAMCAASIYWGNIGRIVFALSGERLYELVKNPSKNPALMLSCRDVIRSGIKDIQITGPIIIDGAEEIHSGFWD